MLGKCVDAFTAMALFDGTEDSIDTTLAAIETFHSDALDPTTGDFLMPLTGVLDDPFGVGSRHFNALDS